MVARIGGNVADIQATAGVMTDTGASAVEAGSQAASFASQMEGQVGEVTSVFAQHFEQMADGLRQAIIAARNRLASTDWEGMSKGEADQAEVALNGQVDQVLGNALQSTAEFKTFMLSRAQDFVSMVQGDFNTIMGNIDSAYRDLANASKTFAENLELADQSIKFTG